MSRLEQSVFRERREQLVNVMGANAIAIIATRDEMYRNRDADYKYRADSSFYYLTGFAEPEAVAVLETDENGDYSYTLFCRERHREMEIWTGFRAGIEGALADYGADQAFSIEDLDDEIIVFLLNKERLFVRFGQTKKFDVRVGEWCNQAQKQQRQGGGAPQQMIQLDSILDEMRLIKSAEEIELMQIAGQISAKAHLRAMQTVYPGMMEYQLEAELNYVFGQHGCVPSYNTIVGGGANGCILHYVENDQPLKDGDLVLIDAGCEYQYYAGDITRTFPVNGKFSGEQKALYDIILSAQLAAIDATRVGQHYRYPHEIVCKIFTEGLVDLGILSGEINELIETEAYKQFYMHGTGHWLGMDVHDVGNYKQHGEWRPYESGMVVTVEPGLYIQADDETVAERWRGIGIRIEDDILVTKDGPHVLTSDVIKSIDDIEHFMKHN
ncbi:Xaa-Pro aminopeptidase [Acinetobacter qingfengensis]|uniref:Xaa-Pro aminopeptidase n=1 Tax=Acinetobacter qingfengensis TaxID=1262585 RepID=A0A1E7R8U7_9GAMM|nr:Xaa-Pro aminopeptidase [Acinetobacter qingfengensis]KAA8735558.1 Xaa-Pro aminopeptidase [Acinetobacter qingfengensis]OEY95794.1 Xaa-Pro aminopeptidase [Acinetobacter qingfengensis]